MRKAAIILIVLSLLAGCDWDCKCVCGAHETHGYCLSTGDGEWHSCECR